MDRSLEKIFYFINSRISKIPLYIKYKIFNFYLLNFINHKQLYYNFIIFLVQMIPEKIILFDNHHLFYLLKIITL